MIRVLIESFLAFMLPAALYISFGLITRGPNTTVAGVFNRVDGDGAFQPGRGWQTRPSV
jgi:hypothetical protein